VLVGKVRLVVRNATGGPILDDQTLGVPQPDLFQSHVPRDSLQLLHGHGNQVGNPDGSLNSRMVFQLSV
jgi:hypothetical protein